MIDDEFMIRILGADKDVRYNAEHERSIAEQIKDNFLVRIVE